MMLAVSIVIPAKNEQDNVVQLVRELTEVMAGTALTYEIIFVDDGSTDRTYAVLSQLSDNPPLHLKVIKHKHSVGQSTAIRTGIHHARGELIVTMDADCQNDPADIPLMLARAKQSNKTHFAVCGYRKQRKDTRWKRVQSRFANRLRAKLLGDGTPDTGCGLKVIPRATYLELPYFNHMHRYIPALVQRLGGEILICEVNHRARHSGNSNYGMWDRAWAGVFDLMGVMWLQRRTKLAEVAEVVKQ